MKVDRLPSTLLNVSYISGHIGSQSDRGSTEAVTPQEVGQFKPLSTRKLPELIHNGIDTNFQLTQNRVLITGNFVCLLIFRAFYKHLLYAQALTLRACGMLSDNFVQNPSVSYRTLVSIQIHPNPKKILDPPTHPKTYAKTKGEWAVSLIDIKRNGRSYTWEEAG